MDRPAMCHNQKALIFTWLFISAMAVALGNGIREIEVKPDPPDDGKQIFTVRFVPDETATYDQIVFDCALQQKLVLLTLDGGQTNKIFESGIFTTRQRNVKMVKGLDCYVSFFAQLGSQRSDDTVGDAGAITNAPVTVARLRITAYRNGKKAWVFNNVNAQGKYRPEEDVALDATSTNVMRKAP